jgi:hypothetical protein
LIKLEDMEEEFGVRIPWKRRVMLIAEERMIRVLILKKITEGFDNAPDISKDSGIEDRIIRKFSYKLEEEGLLIIDRSSIPYRLRISK